MFRAAFPSASDHDEKLEMQWVKENYDLAGNNGTTKDTHITRLAGTWVGPSVAVELGDLYSLGPLINTVVDAKPDPTANYRRSGKSAGSTGTPKPPTPASPLVKSTPARAIDAKSIPASSPSPAALAHPAKRRKESSPAPAPVFAPALAPAAKNNSDALKAPRRSTRTKSPAPRSTGPLMSVISASTPAKTPKVVKALRRAEALTPGGSDETVVDDENEAVEDDVAGSQLREQDIKEQKLLIEDLKAKREAALQIELANKEEEGEEEEESDEGEDEVKDGGAGVKRAREDEEEPLKFDFKEPQIGDRVIATNTRVSRFQMEPRTKSFAWGVAAFAVGMSAV